MEETASGLVSLSEASLGDNTVGEILDCGTFLLRPHCESRPSLASMPLRC